MIEPYTHTPAQAPHLSLMIAETAYQVVKELLTWVLPGVLDFSDRIQSVTVGLYGLVTVALASVGALKWRSIVCYVPVGPSGADFARYMNTYCWLHGTIPLRPEEPLPDTEKQWNDYDAVRRISKYICPAWPHLNFTRLPLECIIAIKKPSSLG